MGSKVPQLLDLLGLCVPIVFQLKQRPTCLLLQMPPLHQFRRTLVYVRVCIYLDSCSHVHRHNYVPDILMHIYMYIYRHKYEYVDAKENTQT